MTGIITLEDIIEEILGTEIKDEYDFTDEPEFFKNPQFRDMDFARLKLLGNSKMADDQLTPDEVRAIVSHLSTNVPQIRNLFEGNLEGLTDLIKKSNVLKMKRSTPAGSLQPVQEDMIYRRGKVSSMCTLVLSGSLTILAGKDEFMSEKGPWSMLGVDALTMAEGSYIPDFSAFIASDTVRFVSISLSIQAPKHYPHHHDHHDHHHHDQTPGSTSTPGSTAGSTAGTRPRSLSRGGSFVGAHSLAERKQSLHRKRSIKEAMALTGDMSLSQSLSMSMTGSRLSTDNDVLNPLRSLRSPLLGGDSSIADDEEPVEVITSKEEIALTSPVAASETASTTSNASKHLKKLKFFEEVVEHH